MISLSHRVIQSLWQPPDGAPTQGENAKGVYGNRRARSQSARHHDINV